MDVESYVNSATLLPFTIFPSKTYYVLIATLQFGCNFCDENERNKASVLVQIYSFFSAHYYLVKPKSVVMENWQLASSLIWTLVTAISNVMYECECWFSDLSSLTLSAWVSRLGVISQSLTLIYKISSFLDKITRFLMPSQNYPYAKCSF